MSKLSNELVAIDLFAGAGGLGEGLEAAGISVSVAIELHPQPALTYAFNHPNTDVYFGDIRKLNFEVIKAKLYEKHGHTDVALVAGGPPCQGFSSAGKKNVDDPRNSMFMYFYEFVKFFRPTMFLLENVPGFKKMYDGKVYKIASQLFSELGYTLSDNICEAKNYGVPQKRTRFIMVGVDDIKNSYSWPVEKYSGIVDVSQYSLIQQSKKPLVTVKDAIDDLSFLEPGYECHIHQSPSLSQFQSERRNGCNYTFNHLATQHRDKIEKMFSFIREGQTISSVPEEYKTNKRTMARWDRNNISNAVLALPDDLLHYKHNRIPTVRELARLQTFDDDYVFIGKRTSGFVERKVDVPQYTQVGNAVPPLLARCLGEEIVKMLNGHVGDIRDISERRLRHNFVLGSSGYTGYSLSVDCKAAIKLHHVQDMDFELPLNDSLPVACMKSGLTYWKNEPRDRRASQWCPGVVKPQKTRSK